MFGACLHLIEIAYRRVIESLAYLLAYELRLTSDGVLFYVTDTHPLMWWKNDGAKYPRLVHHLVLKYLEFLQLLFIQKDCSLKLAKLSADSGPVSETNIS